LAGQNRPLSGQPVAWAAKRPAGLAAGCGEIRRKLHGNPDAAGAAGRNPQGGLGIIFDRNGQVRFDKPMLTKAMAKTTVHATMHNRWPTLF
jgi:hypothetical protein